jgi:hypothetical protein
MLKTKLHKRKVVIYVAGLIVIAVLAFQTVIDISVFRNLIQVRPDYGTVFATLVEDATKQLNKPAPVDAKTGKIYIPQARLVLPSYTGFGQVEYMYEAGQYTSDNATEIHLTSSSILNSAENKLWVDIANANNRTVWQSYNSSNLFTSLPSLQACTRGVQIFYSRQNLGSDYVFQNSHKLSDGRTLYIYSESGCKQDQSAIITLASEAQSY